MSLRQEVGIHFDDRLKLPVNTDWKFIPVEAASEYLTEYIEGFINYARVNNILLRIEQYIVGSSKTEVAYEVDTALMSNNEIIFLIKSEGCVCDTLIVTSDNSAVLLSTHDLTSILIANEVAIKEITGKSVLEMQREYAEYISPWSGNPGKYAKFLLKLSSDYPEMFLGSPFIEIDFDTIV